MNQDNTAAESGTDDGYFYKAVQAACLVPDTDCAIINHRYAVFRNMHLHLAAVQEQVRQSGYTPAIITIYTDVLVVTPHTRWLLTTSGLLIIARRVVCAGPATVVLNYSHHNTARLVIFADEWQGILQVSAVGEKMPVQEWSITAQELHPGFAIGFTGGAIQATAITPAQVLPLQLPGDLQLYLTHQYIMACLCSKERPHWSQAVLTWILGWTAGNDQLRELHLRCTALLVPDMHKLLQQTDCLHRSNAVQGATDVQQYRQRYAYLFACPMFTVTDIALVQTMIQSPTANAVIPSGLPLQTVQDALALLAQCTRQNQQASALLVHNLQPGEKPILALMQRLYLQWLDATITQGE